MLDQLFGSKTRVMLLKLFFENPENAYFVRELTRELDVQINSIRRELNNLHKLGIVKVVTDVPIEKEVWESDEEAQKGINRKKFYQLNSSFVLHKELESFFLKSHLMLEQDLIEKMKTLPNVQYLVLTGFFTGGGDSMVDVLAVGTVSKSALSKLIGEFEKKLNREINYTTMSAKEFQYRKDITDKFLYDILVGPKIVVVDELKVVE